ncbi:MAG TPA: ABC transporter permease [Cyclobacteriaceae bacterium]
MIHHYLKIAFRNLVRQRFYTLINIFGLALGLACTVLIGHYIHYELSYDTIHPDVERLYRVNQTNIWYPEQGAMSSTGLPLAKILADDFPEVESSLRINTPYRFTVRYDDSFGNIKAFNEDDFLASDSNFFEFFEFKLKEGDPATALKGLNKVVISDEASARLFGEEPGLGKIILMGEDRIPLEVTGVTESQPENIHFDFDYLISIYTNPNIKRFEWSWIWTQAVTYIKLKEDANPEDLEGKMESLVDLHVAPSFKRFGIDFSEFIKGGSWNFYLQPVTRIHLYSAVEGNRIGNTGDIKYIYIFGLVGIFILMIAVINFINLATARAGIRAKEIGIKKVMGSQKRNLIMQFLSESMLVTFISLGVGLAVMEIIRILLNKYLLIPMLFSIWENPVLLLIMPLFAIIIGILAGLYPAFYITRLAPGEILKGRITRGVAKSNLRNLLVVVQFTISIILIAATLIVSQQVNFFLNSDLGFEKENILLINNSERLGGQLQSYVDQLDSETAIKGAAISMLRPGRGGFEDIYSVEGYEEKYPMSTEKVDANYFSIMNLKFRAGRPFAENSISDRNSVIINESTARLFNWTPEEALSHRLNDLGDELEAVPIIGVVKDFHFQPLQNKIGPLLIFHENGAMWGDMRVVIVKYDTKMESQLVNLLQSKWHQILPDTPFEYEFLDQTLAEQYDFEKQLGGLFSFFTTLSIVIAIIGLIGLVAFASEQRRREIGIRKVLGAPVLRILVMLNSHHLKLIVLSLIFAVPVAWYAMDNWLSGFPYKIEISPWVFLLAGGSVAFLSLLCVSYLSIRAASLNPAEVLKEE